MWKEYLKEAKKRKKPNPYAERKIDLSNPKFQRDIIDTNHAIDRFVNGRHNEEETPPKVKAVIDDPKKFKELVREVVKKGIIEIMKKHKDVSGNYGISSKSTNIHVIIDWRKDYKSTNDSRNHAIIVTVLPIKKNVKFKDIKSNVIVEGKEINLIANIEID